VEARKHLLSWQKGVFSASRMGIQEVTVGSNRQEKDVGAPKPPAATVAPKVLDMALDLSNVQQDSEQGKMRRMRALGAMSHRHTRIPDHIKVRKPAGQVEGALTERTNREKRNEGGRPSVRWTESVPPLSPKQRELPEWFRATKKDDTTLSSEQSINKIVRHQLGSRQSEGKRTFEKNAWEAWEGVSAVI
jgi:hypothetical protein